ncbi:helix-turn-helix domain-containing protein [Paracoccus cavernae]|uniref:helix-turn-helix domain-containing protein n=1 Tax=Paracoccus cavernae TaxID=1571207 RepID=UPI0035F2A5E3
MNNIARIRKARGLRQGDLAEMVGISQPHISRIEGGDEGPPLSLFRTIADALNVPLAALFSDARSHIEQAVLDAFRSLPENRQAGWVEMARLVQAEAQAANQASDPDRHAKEK